MSARFTLDQLPERLQHQVLAQLNPPSHVQPKPAAHDHRPPPRPKPKRAPVPPLAGCAQGKGGHPGRILVSITSHRRRLLDPDNIVVKYFVDCLRYSGLLRDDRNEDIELRVSQKKVQTAEEERTEITLTPL